MVSPKKAEPTPKPTTKRRLHHSAKPPEIAEKSATEDDSDAPKSSPKKKTHPQKKAPVDDTDEAPAHRQQSASAAADSDATEAPKKSPPASKTKDAALASDAADETGATHKTIPSKPADSDEAAPKKKATVSTDTEGVPAPATDRAGTSVAPQHAPSASIDPGEIREFEQQPARIQELIRTSLELTKKNLTYTYGSAEPSSGGMDCSGTIFYVLQQMGFKDVPRDSSGQYIWARKNGQFYSVLSKSGQGFEFTDLQPGDLMFWTGTYKVDRDVPITHVMLYLGTEKKSKKRIMFGSSDGRSYDGVQRWGVSVFDFKMPKPDPANPEKTKAEFVGYAHIPGLRDAAETAKNETSPSKTATSPDGSADEKPSNSKPDTAREKTPSPRGKSATSPDSEKAPAAFSSDDDSPKTSPKKRPRHPRHDS